MKQRFGLDNVFKRTILDMITNELLQRHAASDPEAKVLPSNIQDVEQAEGDTTGSAGTHSRQAQLSSGRMDILSSSDVIYSR